MKFSILIIKVKNANIVKEPVAEAVTDHSKKRVRFKWTDYSYQKLIESDYIPVFLEHIENSDINGAISSLTKLLQDVSKESKCVNTKTIEKAQSSPWWDNELETMRYQKFKCLKSVRRENNDYAKSKYKNVKNEFKMMIRNKKTMYKNDLRKRIENCNLASDFWKIVKSMNHSRDCVNKISSEDWKNYFVLLLNSPNPVDEKFKHEVNEYLNYHDENCVSCKTNINGHEPNVLNSDITLVEIENVIIEIQKLKAPGIDGVTNDILKKGKIMIVPMLQVLFNKILEMGEFRTDWCDAIIIPVYKKGNVNDPNNYRGISLLSSISKIFTKVINNRLVKWAENENKMSELQAGFTKGKSTVDHIFVLQCLIGKYLNRKRGRFYAVFVDFSKAFDSVPHFHLFHGRTINVLRNMYSKVKSCVQIDKDMLSESFSCQLGTRQGCMLSPFLFICYLNELIEMSVINDCKGIFLDAEHPNISMLLYADDLVFVGDNIGRVQKLLDTLNTFCNKWGLKVNLDKTKFMVYRNGGIIKNYEVLY